MISRTRSFREPWKPIGVLILLAALAVATGCSTAESPGGSSTNMNHVLPSGSSVDGWLVTPSGGTHASTATQDYLANNGSSGCTQCHGSDLSGGISNVSCFGNTAGCHHGPIAGWVAVPPAAQNHGVSAKKAPGSSGFASCQICHGNNFAGTAGGPTCFNNTACHGAGVFSPHARKPWHGSPYTHTTTDKANAPVCAKCHFLDSPNNPANHPATPAPEGTAPGCFNNTLCHGENPVPHPLDNAWAPIPPPPAAQPHGNDAKAALGATTGFAYCQVCHGTGTTSPANFGGGSSTVDCYFCHGVSAPHAPKPWRASVGSPYTHTDTDPSNAPVCAQCHQASPGAPGCFNSTLCHDRTFHPAGWDQVTQHGPVAKQAPSAFGGFSYCQACHGSGTNFSGGAIGISCYTCHGVNAPHPSGATWRNSTSPTHRTTNLANADVCAFCHRNTNPGTPGCFNGTLCHNGGGGGAPHLVPYNDNSHFTVTTATFSANCGTCHAVTGTSPVSGAPLCTTCHVASPLTALNCTSCHASPPNGVAPAGAVYANIPGAHGTHIALNSTGTPISCTTCHNGLGTGTLNHYNRAKARVAPGDVALLATYNAQTVPFSFDNTALSCSNVSCHGGQATPNWQTGAIVVNDQCTNCHISGTTQFNSYNSGEHTFHVNLFGATATTCKRCHNTTTLEVNHLTTLGTTAMEGPASATIGGGSTTVTSYVGGSCTPSVGSSGGCHSTRSW